MHRYTHWTGDKNSHHKQKKIIKIILATILLSLALMVASAGFAQETQAHVADEEHGFTITPVLEWDGDSLKLTTQISESGHAYVANADADWGATVVVYRYVEGGEVVCNNHLFEAGLSSYYLESSWLASGYSSDAFEEQKDILNRHDAVFLTIVGGTENPPIQYEYYSTLNERGELTDYISGDKELGLCFGLRSLDDSHIFLKNIVIEDFDTLSYSEVGTSSDSNNGGGNNANNTSNQNTDNSGDVFGTGDGGTGNSDAGSKPSESPDTGIANDINYVFYGFIVTAIILTFPVAQIVYKSNQNKKKDAGKA